MKNIQALREQRDSIAKGLNEMMNGPAKDTWNAEYQAKYDAGMKQIDDLEANIKRHIDFHAKMATENNESNIYEAANRLERDNGSTSSALFAKWLRGGDNAMTAEDWTQIRNTMSTTTPAEGGYTVPTEVSKDIANALKSYGGMRNVATVLVTSNGAPLNFPTSNGTAETGEQVAENVTATNGDVSFGSLSLNTYKYSSKTIAVPFELLQDSSIDVESFVKDRLVQRIARITNTKFTVGTGASEPNGVVTASGSGKVGLTGQTTSVLIDDLIDLVHAIDPAYRNLNRCQFMMNDSSLKVLRKMKDTAGRPIFMPGYDGLGGAMGDMVLGYKVDINQDVASMAANAKSILFGDFSFYTIRDALETSFFRFTDSAYTKLGQVGFLMFARSGGNYIDVGGGVKYYQNSAT